MTDIESSQRPDLSLVIPTHNTRQLVAECVASILGHRHGLQCEVIVVDDASTDATSDYLQSRFPQIRVIRNLVSLGYGGAANQGMTLARGRWIAISNSDIEMTGDALTRLVSFLEAHPEAGAVGPKLLNSDGSHQKSVSRHPTVLANAVRLVVPPGILEAAPILWVLRNLAKHLKLNLGRLAQEADSPLVVECVMGAFFVVRRAVIETVGGFDSDRFYMFAEEADWFLRMQRAGWSVYYLPEAQVIHYGSATVNDFRHRYVVQQYKSFLYFYEKHFGRRTVFLYKALLTPIFVAKALWYGSLAFFPVGDRLEMFRRFETYITIIRLLYDRVLQTRNVMRDLRFKYIPTLETSIVDDIPNGSYS
ncbi:MAG TPA: glycosyltransferase family 2 protein [Pyrinomonadaceae bacterium]|nr:glycosyltransferase family 2 protein [Pyrinomonadaceae bacterium]